jgi:uncharacterized delta-60 repeat protein
VRRCLALLVALATAGLLAGALPAAQGDLDPTFGTGGKVVTDFGASEIGFSIAHQPDGKVVVAGGDNFALARYTGRGALDPTFDGDGKITTDFGGLHEAAYDVAIQPDGKLVAVGYAFNPSVATDFGVARYNEDGSLDHSFGVGGKLFTTFTPNSLERAEAVALQSDGKIVVAGWVRTPPTPTLDFGLARYLPDGTLDRSFDGDGLVITAVTGDNDELMDVAVQPDGKIVAAGSSYQPEGRPNFVRSDIALTRYNQDGSLDPSFDGDGIVAPAFSPLSSPDGEDLVLQRDGKLLVTGVGTMTRFNADGSLDRTFGEGGTTSSWGAFEPRAAAIQPDGKILAIGTASIIPGSVDFSVARLTADGRFDTAYGPLIRGGVATDFGNSEDLALDGVLQPDGKLTVTGMTRSTYGSGPWDIAVARYVAIRFCVVPKARGKTLRVARSSLMKTLCRVGTVRRKYSAQVKKGRVISQRPAPGTRVAEFTKVNLVVSRGPRRR